MFRSRISIGLLGVLLCSAAAGCAGQQPAAPTAGAKHNAGDTVGLLAVGVTASRIFSFTDKLSGYFYGGTHDDHLSAWHAGWNIATRRILSDYTVLIDGRPLARTGAQVTVLPDHLIRRFPEAVETLRLFDGEPVLSIGLSDIRGARIGLRLQGELLRADGLDGNVLWLTPVEDSGRLVALATRTPAPLRQEQDGTVSASAAADGFLLVHGTTADEVKRRLDRARRDGDAWADARRHRMERLLVEAGGHRTGDPDIDRALAWLALTGDSLSTRQQGAGIYAGLPWFNDYWGRDIFISLPGISLVTGQFDAARDILLSFARLQDTDPTSPTYGRVPNRARPDEVIYNTTDGTPRFVIAVLDYLHYSGDRSIVPEIYPAVQRATDAALANWTDVAGYLRHDDADTWMDAKEKGVRPFTPRGDRANDIQALWHGQLLAAAELAGHVGDEGAAARWRAAAARIEARFAADFIDPATGAMADHLNRDGSRDLQMRPNQLFALHLLPDADQRLALSLKSWRELVYPWGVASLSQDDPDFHPWHEHWHYYHKDAAYHNGTVWLWLNGIAMQRLIEADLPDPAYELFAGTLRQALHEGAVGSLAENADALPRPGADRAALSGTFLQAWSNAEHLRVWHQHFLGVKPDMLRGVIQVRPNLPAALPAAQAALRAGPGRLHIDYAAGEPGTYRFRSEGMSPILAFSLPGFPETEVAVPDGATLEATRRGGELQLRLIGPDGGEMTSLTRAADPQLVDQLERRHAAARDLSFAVPRLNPGLKSLSTFHDPPLTY